jgi:hypothetical protein
VALAASGPYPPNLATPPKPNLFLDSRLYILAYQWPWKPQALIPLIWPPLPNPPFFSTAAFTHWPPSLTALGLYPSGLDSHGHPFQSYPFCSQLPLHIGLSVALAPPGPYSPNLDIPFKPTRFLYSCLCALASQWPWRPQGHIP